MTIMTASGSIDMLRNYGPVSDSNITVAIIDAARLSCLLDCRATMVLVEAARRLEGHADAKPAALLLAVSYCERARQIALAQGRP